MPRKTKFDKYIEEHFAAYEAHVGHAVTWYTEGRSDNKGTVERVTVDKRLQSIVLWVRVEGQTFLTKVYAEALRACDCNDYEGA